MSKKIGIITYHKSQNYGALLQAYALFTFLKNNGYETKMIDYWPEYHRNMYKLFSWKQFWRRSFLGKLKYIYIACFTFIRHGIRRNNTDRFVKSHFSLDRTFKYDTAVYGSDQIWRKQSDADNKYYNPVYFANDFINANHKIAYAGSMGKIEVNCEFDETWLSEAWYRFDAISVREKDLKDLIWKISNIDVPVVLDPVFLLSKTEWIDFINRYRTNVPKSENFIVYYRLQDLKYADEFVKNLAKESRCEIIEFSGYIRPLKYSSNNKETLSVIDFLSYVLDAKYVVANAFHGLAMSLCLEKQFYVFSEETQSNRLQSLLSIAGLESRLNPLVQETLPINYSNVNERLDIQRKVSRNWLLKNI